MDIQYYLYLSVDIGPMRHSLASQAWQVYTLSIEMILLGIITGFFRFHSFYTGSGVYILK